MVFIQRRTVGEAFNEAGLAAADFAGAGLREASERAGAAFEPRPTIARRQSF